MYSATKANPALGVNTSSVISNLKGKTVCCIMLSSPLGFSVSDWGVAMSSQAKIGHTHLLFHPAGEYS